MSNDYLLKKRIRVAKIISTLLVGVPFVRCVVLNGSLTQGKVRKSSDIDLLIIAKRRHIFTVRFITMIMVWLTGIKRSSDATKYHGGKICLNYYLTDEFLIIPHNRGMEINKYCAENYSKSLLLAGDQLLFDEFMNLNMNWMERYLINQKSKPENKSLGIMYQKPESASQNRVKNYFEERLSGRFGNKLETYLKKVQLARINRDPRTKKYPDLIVANDNEMRFHPPKRGEV